MPTKRTRTFLIVALLFYLVANQTQVGWLFVVSALLAGLVPASWWLNRLMLRDLSGDREIRNSTRPPALAAADYPGSAYAILAESMVEIHEADAVQVALILRQNGRLGGQDAAHVAVQETCPLAAAGSDGRHLSLFIPSIPNQSEARVTYDVTVDRRGLHQFPPLALQSTAPFGFFRRRRQLAIPTSLLVYPEVRPVSRLDLFDFRRAAERDRPRSGLGTEIMGIRPYRAGDSPRHIHWRTVARTQRLISKEFVDEAQPGVTVILDLFRHPYPRTESKHTPFEWSVKIAASIGDYAQRAGYPLHLVADAAVLPVPLGALSWHPYLEYLAHIQPNGHSALPQVVNSLTLQTFVAVLLPWPDIELLPFLAELNYSRPGLLAIVLDPASFPAGGPTADSFFAALGAGGIDARLIRFGDDWAGQIMGNAQPPVEKTGAGEKIREAL